MLCARKLGLDGDGRLQHTCIDVFRRGPNLVFLTSTPRVASEMCADVKRVLQESRQDLNFGKQQRP